MFSNALRALALAGVVLPIYFFNSCGSVEFMAPYRPVQYGVPLNHVNYVAPPHVAFTSPPNNSTLNASGTARLEGVCTDGLPIQIVSAALPSTLACICTDGRFSQSVTFMGADGLKTVTVSQTNVFGMAFDELNLIKSSGGGNPPPLLPPVVEITAPAANSEVGERFLLVGNCTGDLPLSLSGPGLASPKSDTCRNGGFQVEVLTTPGLGPKMIVVSQSNGAGNHHASRSFMRVDATTGSPPVVQITSPPANTAAAFGVLLEGLCTDGLIVQLSGAGLGSPSQATCSQGRFSVPVIFSNGDGQKLITVSQVSSAGRGTDSRLFIKDSSLGVGGGLAIEAPAAGSTIADGVIIQGRCLNGYTVEFTNGVVSPVTVACRDSKFSAAVFLTPGVGPITIAVQQTPPSGVLQDSRNFVVPDQGDGEPENLPYVRIDTPKPLAIVADGQVVGGICTQGLPVRLSGEGLLGLTSAASAPDGAASNMNASGGAEVAPIEIACTNSRFQAPLAFTPGEGIKKIEASQTNSAGTGKSTREFIVLDTPSGLPPIITIVFPAENAIVPESVTIQGACESGHSVFVRGPGSILQNVTVPCLGGTYQAPVAFSSGLGIKSVQVTQSNLFGTTTISRNFIRGECLTGICLPVVTISSPLPLAVIKDGTTMTGECTANLDVTVSGPGLREPKVVNCQGGKYSVALPLIPGPGIRSVWASQTNAAGTGVALRDFQGESASSTLPPVMSWLYPAANTSAVQGLLIIGTCTPSLNVTISGSGALKTYTTPCVNYAFSEYVEFSTGDGVKTLKAKQSNAGGTVEITRNFLRVTNDPLLSDMLLIDDFERNQLDVGQNSPFSWSEIINDLGTGGGANIDALIFPGSQLVNAPSGSKSLYFRGRQGTSKHEIYLISQALNVAAYSRLEVGYYYLPVDLESGESIRLETCQNPSGCNALSPNDWVIRDESATTNRVGNLKNINRSAFQWYKREISIDLSLIPAALHKQFKFRFSVFLDEGILVPLNTWPSPGQNYEFEDLMGLDYVTVRGHR